PDDKSAMYQKFWPADLHMVGKDILRFHAIYWPAFLMAAGLEPPRRVFAHGWWTNEGQKISKSVGNVIDPLHLIERYGLDQTRYFLLREIPFGNDGDYSHRGMVQRMTSDLANGIGNLAQRSLSLINKNCNAAVPQPGAFDDADEALITAAEETLDKVRGFLQEQAFHKALETIWQVIGETDRYVTEQAPWALRKTDPARMNTVLYVLAETIRRLGLLLQPVMPHSAAKLLDQLALDGKARNFTSFGRDHALVPGTVLPKPEGVFPRFVEEAAAS
ncbi:MAG TPA: methionine--tRNA ligase, partial [Dongiaceae bacterium]